MTLYNEPLDQLKNSLSALIASIEAQEYATQGPATRSCIVIIADGRDRVDADILQFFQSAGLMDTASSFLALGETVHFSRHRAGDTMATLGAGGQFRCEVSFAICVKNLIAESSILMPSFSSRSAPRWAPTSAINSMSGQWSRPTRSRSWSRIWRRSRTSPPPPAAS